MTKGRAVGGCLIWDSILLFGFEFFESIFKDKFKLKYYIFYFINFI